MQKSSSIRYGLFFIALFTSAWAQTTPEPPQPDIPYLIHASNLVETQQSEAAKEQHKKRVIFAIPRATSGVKTPMASPEFLFKAETINPAWLRLFRLESKNGRRELLYRKKKKQLAFPIRTSMFEMDQPGVVKIRVDESLDVGEYCLTPDGSNQVFCFTVY